MKNTLFPRHRNTVELMMFANDRQTTLQALHADAVNKTVKSSPPINNSEKDLTRKERATLAQLKSGYCAHKRAESRMMQASISALTVI